MSTMPYLLEIGCEEIPARFMDTLLEDLEKGLKNSLEKANLGFSGLQPFGTYRRFGVLISQLNETSTASSAKIKGPLTSIAMDGDGALLPPGLGFVKRFGLQESDVFCEDEQGKSYLFAYKKSGGELAKDLLPELIKKTILSLPLPIAMKWGDNQGPFIRPVHWVVSLLGKDILPFELFKINAGRQSYGHRMLSINPKTEHLIHGQPVQIEAASDAFFDHLRAVHVEIDPEKRSDIIKDELRKINHSLVGIDSKLLNEVVWLTEWPKAIKGSFDSAYLEVPQEVLIESMVKNQKYFPILKDNKLTNSFIIMAENVTAENEDVIRSGNQKVLKARLDDAKFFWEEDKKIPLETHLEKLKKTTFQKGLGTMWDKVERLKKLSLKVAGHLKFRINPPDLSKLEEAARLCKADLSTHMVYEFGNLQGIMGSKYYSIQQVEAGNPVDTEIRDAIAQQYGLVKPTNHISFCLSLADKIDTITACFSNGLIPTGSQDPWGVRRALYGIFNILEGSNNPQLDHKEKDVSLFALLDFGFEALNTTSNQDKCRQFTKERIAQFFKDTHGYPHDVVAAVLDNACFAFFEAQDVAKKLAEDKEYNPAFKLLVETAVRINRLSKNAANSQYDASHFSEAIEEELYELVSGLPKKLDLVHLYWLSELFTQYFDKVLVMDNNEVIRNNRLGFLSHVNERYLSVAQFEKIVL